MPKYKNYRNNFSKSNVIYTNADLSRMSFGEASNRRKELVSQYRQIGFPSEKEMQNSSNVVYVNEYTRADGTHVKAHWRSKPEGLGSGTFAPEGQPNIIFDEGEPTVVFDESASNNLEEDVGIYFPTTMPTKAPDGPVIYPVETGEGSGTTIGDIIDGVLGWLSLLLEIMTILLGSNTAPVVDDGEMELQVDNSPLGNFAVPVSSSETSSKPLKFENINNEEFIQRFISEMMGLGGSGVGNVLPQIAGDGIIRNEKSPNARFDKANFDKGTSVKQKQGVTFDNAKTTSNPINQPMAQHSDSDIENYINELFEGSSSEFIGENVFSGSKYGKYNTKKITDIFEELVNAKTDYSVAKTQHEKNQEIFYTKTLQKIFPFASSMVKNGLYDLKEARNKSNTKIYESLLQVSDLRLREKLKNKKVKDFEKGIEYDSLSDISHEILNSFEFKNYVKEFLKKGNMVKSFSFELMRNQDLYATLQKVEVFNPKISESGIFTCKVIDRIDFDKLRNIYNPINIPNNWGYHMQEKGVFKPYFIIINIKVPVKEIFMNKLLKKIDSYE